MKLKPLHIGDLTAPVPIIQGGMGIGVSGSQLASAVANEGGIGVISGVQIGYKEEDFRTDNMAANIRGLKKEIKKARELSPEGIIGINILTAINYYKETVTAAVEEGIDIVISGAGLPKELPALVEGSKTLFVPIVSSGRAASLLSKMWDKKFNLTADAFIVEGPEAGGHLGFSKEDLSSSLSPLTSLVTEVKESLKPYIDKYQKDIPIIAAGGIYTGQDIAIQLNNGADGVQMATRFVATEECDAHKNFKQLFVDAEDKDIKIIDSPINMPGRAIRNALIDRHKQGVKEDLSFCYRCIRACNPAKAPYCISNALIASVTGDVKDGLVFCGSNASKIDRISTVKELMDELITDAEKYYKASATA